MVYTDVIIRCLVGLPTSPPENEHGSFNTFNIQANLARIKQLVRGKILSLEGITKSLTHFITLP